MIAQVEQPDGTFVDEERVPECGEDFCERCGDCLACQGDVCYVSDSENLVGHVWVVYL